jgi:hypothetical protein
VTDIYLDMPKWKHYLLCANRNDGRVSPCPTCLSIELGMDMAIGAIYSQIEHVKPNGRAWSALTDAIVRINAVKEAR